ncbi:hypothetical protein GCM10010911_64190 [Paenibacillus nasutitermitis]|uniref:Major facilitator superfamily (MFS) profile domain-containing protein n=2 Tax=Paenibacillus nasutitermitis TaxID=1652958 RepID=A0A916ZGD8_9BACL|nr:hypothetical protein GCM10010911_64190 [Paenibacillus nasutitermitis]
MEPMVHAYGINYGDGGQLVMHSFLGGMVGVLLAPWMISKLGKKPLLLVALGLIVIGETVYVCQPPWEWMLVAAPFAGYGLGTMEAIVSAFIIGASLGNANVAMSRVEVFFGVGALIMPFAGAALIAKGHWIAAFGVVGAMAVITMILWVLFWPTILDRPAVQHADGGDGITQKLKLSRIIAVLAACCTFFIMYVGTEMSFVHYLPSLLVQSNGLTDGAASLSLSVFWGAMVLGRLVAGQLADRWGGAAYLLATSCISLVLFVLMGGFGGPWAMFLLTFGAGLAMSGMFAIALVFANRALPGMTERTISLLMACGGIGGAFLPRFTGWFLDENGADATRWLFAGYALLMLGVVIWALLVSRPAKQPVQNAHNARLHSTHS